MTRKSLRSTFSDRIKSYQTGAEEIIKEARESPNDRTAAIILGGLLEDFIRLNLSVFSEKTKKQNDRSEREEAVIQVDLFEGYGPLSTLSARISMIYALGLVNKVTRDELVTLKSIRNVFAHDTSNTHFQRNDIVKECGLLKFGQEQRREIVKTAREVFTDSVSSVMALLAINVVRAISKIDAPTVSAVSKISS